MEYKTLYRQWRPQRFAEVVGQEYITKTLINAIKNNRVGHAYLFCGPRGTGKTSTAKIMGKSINCMNRQGAEPCNECESCQRIDKGLSMDVQEIDAASNRGIEEIRDLREKVKYAPSEGKYKVYIIDEVHMLTTEAFNALLKTLEEPPQHVVFVMATTEPHKIPATILSRCQRFDFRRIGNKQIIDRLEQIASSQNIKIDREATEMIAKAANGGLRDALSTLDQCMAYAEDKITVTEVVEVLGTVTQDVVITIADAMLERQATRLLEAINEVLDEGKDPQLLLQDLLEHFRNILLAQICQEPDNFLVVSQDIMEQIKQQAAKFKRAQVSYVIDVLSKTQNDMKWSNNPKLMLELGLLKTLNYEENLTLEMLVKRIEALESKLNNHNVSKPSVGYPVETDILVDDKTGGSKTVTLQQIKDNWQKIVKGVKKMNISTYAFLVEAEVCRLEDGILTLGYSPEYNFHRERLSQKEHRLLVEHMLKTAFGKEIRVQSVLIDGNAINSNEQVLKKAEEIFGKDKVVEENN
ncbi:MAG: DNA polymerase III subunit gamma/tau [Thermoanaerobacteraceae bacterium]|nr:DNA polymerase III subunit gamma/tau [Thermoanaerobacteraceae bacterium]